MGLLKYKGWIYKITNKISNKVYIGQTYVGIEKRFKQHLCTAFSEKSSSYLGHLAVSIRKYGKDAFEIEQLYEVTAFSKENRIVLLDALETLYIHKYNSNNHLYGYNCTCGGQMPKSNLTTITKALQNKVKHEGCCVTGCTNPHLANGYCSRHYTQLYKKGYIQERTHYSPNEYILHEDYVEIKLYDTKNQYVKSTLIDIEDLDKVINYKWYLSEGPRGEYAKNNNLGTLHGLIIGDVKKGNVIIHLNKNGLDNRKSNLQVVTKTEKQRLNKIPITNKSGVKGVWWCKDRNKWQAQIIINNHKKVQGDLMFLQMLQRQD